MTLNKELQFKMSQTDSFLSKLESNFMNMTNAIKDVQMQLQDHIRTSGMRMNAIESRVGGYWRDGSSVFRFLESFSSTWKLGFLFLR